MRLKSEYWFIEDPEIWKGRIETMIWYNAITSGITGTIAIFTENMTIMWFNLISVAICTLMILSKRKYEREKIKWTEEDKKEIQDIKSAMKTILED